MNETRNADESKHEGKDVSEKRKDKLKRNE
jgi:hypothetical protein